MLRVAIGMPDRSQNTGSLSTAAALLITHRCSVMLCFCTAACCTALYALVSHVYCPLQLFLFVFVFIVILVRQMTKNVDQIQIMNRWSESLTIVHTERKGI